MQPPPPQKKKKLENLTLPPLKVPSPKKAKTHFFKKQKILFPTMKQEHI